jgi:hypothetical protein
VTETPTAERSRGGVEWLPARHGRHVGTTVRVRDARYVCAMSLFELRPAQPRSASGRLGVASRAPAASRQERSGGGTTWWTLVAIAAIAACGLAFVVGDPVVSGDGVWHLVWGRALAEGTLESFATGPTPHPSLLALGAATSMLGDGTGYVVTYALFGPLSFGVLLAAVYDVSRRLSSQWAGVAAVLILGTSAGLVSIASAARYDLAFAALVVIAVALEMDRPRRGVAPLVCLALAGLVRPEAWFLAGAYWLWLVRPLSWSARASTAALVVAAPALWMTMDLLVMGDPLYSLHLTDSASAVLYGQYTPWENLVAAGRNVIWYLGVVPLLLLPAAVVLLARDRLRAALPLVAAFGVTTGVFLLLLSRGMASSERYLLVPICVLAILAAMVVDGCGRRTNRRVVVGVFLAVILCLQVVPRTDVYATVANESAIAHGRHESARALVGLPESFVSDGDGRTRPDLYISPANRAVAKMALTRPRFDDDASFRVPPGLRRGPRNADWALHVAPASRCTRGLR